jgi:transglutaminase-like putative cysteine protease
VAQNLRPGREFSAVREGPRQPRRQHDRYAKALLYVQGPTPLHIRITAYDRFDGRTWREAPYHPLPCPLGQEGDGPWFRLALCRRPAIFADGQSHRIKVGLLRTTRVPAPAHLERFRVGQVNRPDFFAWAQADILRFARRRLPPGTVVETESRTVDPRRLLALDLAPRPSYAPSVYLGLPDGTPPCPPPRLGGGRGGTAATAELAHAWAVGQPPGWAQVQAVVAGLRGRCIHDRRATVPEDCPDVVACFLFTSRRGPDYLFASAAAVMLRALGYPTRVVSGFYTSPQRYDESSRHTAVLGADVHFWAEVLVDPSTWVAVEPTPGYELAPPAFSWGERLAETLQASGGWLLDHRGLGVVALAGVVLTARFRRELLDRLATLGWALAPAASWRGRVLDTLKLLERRARWAGRPRPAGSTPARWYRRAATGAAGPDRDSIEKLLDLADWALYAPAQLDANLPYAQGEVRAACRRAVRAWSLSRFRAQPPHRPATGTPS